MSIEQQIFSLNFPDEEFNADDYNDWVNENPFEAYKTSLIIIKKMKQL